MNVRVLNVTIILMNTLFNRKILVSCCCMVLFLSDYIWENNPMSNRFISVPKDMGRYVLHLEKNRRGQGAYDKE